MGENMASGGRHLQRFVGRGRGAVPEPAFHAVRHGSAELSRDLAMRRHDRGGVWAGLLDRGGRFSPPLAHRPRWVFGQGIRAYRVRDVHRQGLSPSRFRPHDSHQRSHLAHPLRADLERCVQERTLEALVISVRKRRYFARASFLGLPYNLNCRFDMNPHISIINKQVTPCFIV